MHQCIHKLLYLQIQSYELSLDQKYKWQHGHVSSEVTSYNGRTMTEEAEHLVKFAKLA